METEHDQMTSRNELENKILQRNKAFKKNRRKNGSAPNKLAEGLQQEHQTKTNGELIATPTLRRVNASEEPRFGQNISD